MFPLQENEKVTMYVRRHWIWLLLETFGVIVLFGLPVSLVWYLSARYLSPADLFFGYPIQKMADFFVYLWAIFCWIFWADRFTKYALNFWVLTNKRLVESEHVMLFSRKLSTLPLETIEDVTVKYDGILENVIGYGSLTVQTAGTQREFIADDVADPEGVKQAIFNAREGLKQEDREVTVMNVTDVSDAEEISELHHKLDTVYAQAPRIVEEENKNTQNHKLFSIPEDQSAHSYDWANVSAQQAKDTRNYTEDIEVHDEFKKNAEDALRY